MIESDQIANLLILLFSIVLNILGLSLFSHFKVNGKISSANWLIFFQCSVDIVFSVVAFVFRCEFVIINNYIVFFLINFNGINIPFFLYFVFTHLFLTIVFINPPIVATMVYVRYHTVINFKETPNVRMKAVIKLLFASILIDIVGVFSTMYFGIKSYGDQQLLYKFDQTNNYTDMYVNADSRALILDMNNIFVILCAFSGLTYMLILLAIICTYLNFIISNKNQSTETYKLNKDFLRIMFLHTLSPILFLFTPLIILLFYISLQIQSRNLMTYVFSTSPCVPLLNALFLLIVLKKSRQVMGGRFERILNLIYYKTNQISIINVK
uniref:G_PROTEIN_RECEP_F1_2 domain-containing protein n=1 Tax=Rhabditophanes sp. KR3021 TaxID=114890 RepID=A0AC35TQA6_9BILA